MPLGLPECAPAEVVECPTPPPREWIVEIEVPSEGVLWQPGDRIELQIRAGVLQQPGGGACGIVAQRTTRGADESAWGLLDTGAPCAVPEPPAAEAVAIGLVLLLALARRRRR